FDPPARGAQSTRVQPKQRKGEAQMRKRFTALAACISAGAVLGVIFLGGAGAQSPPPPLTFSNGTTSIHVFPTTAVAQAAAGFAGGPLSYHGGPVMQTATLYTIYWTPPTLQTGAATSMPSKYKTIQNNLTSLYAAHGIDNINTQYYQTVGGPTKFIQNVGGSGGSYVDTAAYPGSVGSPHCHDDYFSGNASFNCINDADLQAEVTKVMGIKGWTPGLNKIFLVYTSPNEGSCFTNGNDGVCSYNYYCAYHSDFGSATNPTIYTNEPYGVTATCQNPGQPSPNGHPAGDTASTAASHEISEAITDPELNAWFDSA